MVTCPSGHESASDDFCDVCGIRIGLPELSSIGAGQACPACGAPRTGHFCEDCGHNFASATPAPQRVPQFSAPPPPEPTRANGTWSAVVTADRRYFDSVQGASGPEAAGIGFPAYCPERRFRLAGGEVRIGRRSASRGIDPEIDLTGPPADPGVSRLHAVLIAAPDGSWSVLDPGSANGTLVNGNEIPANEAVPLRDGDRINLGAWTLVTVSRER
jgi:hypothetical protein